MSTNSIGNNTTWSISMKPDMAKEAENRAKNLGLGRSAYLRKLIERDLELRPDFVLSEKTAKYKPKH
jgi:predicted DNA-binding protein